MLLRYTRWILIDGFIVTFTEIWKISKLKLKQSHKKLNITNFIKLLTIQKISNKRTVHEVFKKNERYKTSLSLSILNISATDPLFSFSFFNFVD